MGGISDVRMWTFAVLAAIVTSSYGREIGDCYAMDNNPYINFASKTAYHYVYGRPRQHQDYLPDCEPVQVWMLARHGTRYPGKANIRAMQELEALSGLIASNHEEKKAGRLCYADLDRLKGWTLNMSFTDAKMLAPQGRSDLYELAKRMRSRFPTLLEKEYAPNLYLFRHTDTDRTRQSARAFAEGMFGAGEGVYIPQALENDTIIKPYENCTSWRTHVRQDPANRREIDLFNNGLDMSTLVRNVSSRLGFGYELPLDTIQLMYDMCRYDKALHLHAKSTWCAAFAREELMVLEYGKDLANFYESGYGHPFNLRLGCAPLKDLIMRFTLLENDDLTPDYAQPMGVFYFTHSDMIAMTLARMGIAGHGKPMRHDNYADQKRREWATSNLLPFAANLAAVFYKCRAGERNRIMFLLNEKVIDYPGCEYGLCSWSDVKERFIDIPYSCDMGWCSSGVTLHYAIVLIGMLCMLTRLF